MAVRSSGPIEGFGARWTNWIKRSRTSLCGEVIAVCQAAVAFGPMSEKASIIEGFGFRPLVLMTASSRAVMPESPAARRASKPASRSAWLGLVRRLT